MAIRLTLQLLDGAYAVTLLMPDAPTPGWLDGPGFSQISRADDEITVVCRADRVPPDAESDAGWRALRVAESVGFDVPGIVLSAVAPISGHGHAVFVASTWRRDYILVRAADLELVTGHLRDAGHTVLTPHRDRSDA